MGLKWWQFRPCALLLLHEFGSHRISTTSAPATHHPLAPRHMPVNESRQPVRAGRCTGSYPRDLNLPVRPPTAPSMMIMNIPAASILLLGLNYCRRQRLLVPLLRPKQDSFAAHPAVSASPSPLAAWLFTVQERPPPPPAGRGCSWVQVSAHAFACFSVD